MFASQQGRCMQVLIRESKEEATVERRHSVKSPHFHLLSPKMGLKMV
jgi:hypothetical protein